MTTQDNAPLLITEHDVEGEDLPATALLPQDLEQLLREGPGL